MPLPQREPCSVQLDIQSVSHSYGTLPVLDSVSFTVRDGEVVALIGPSGCGKSTLLAIVGGLLRPQAGAVFQEGEAPAGCINPLTYVFQDFALLPWRSVEGNIRLVLRGLAAREVEARIEEVLAQTHLSDFRRAYPKQLSGGMRQRVGIARALAVRPAVLLMDEPLSSLDAQTRVILLDEFAELFQRAGVTAVYVTHNLAEAVRLADRVVVLSRRPGRVKDVVPIAVPRPERAIDSPAMLAVERRLWNLIRDEAVLADQELADAR